MTYYVAIDIGGTSIKYGLIDKTETLIEKYEIDTEAFLGGAGIMGKVCLIIDHFDKKLALAGICISTAGMVDPETGEVFFSGPTIPNYAGTNFKETLEEKYGIPCEVENDVNCAGLAEVISGSAKRSEVTLCLTVGTGIGGCTLIGNNVFHGFNNSACEVGYLSLGNSNFQEKASTTTLVRNVADLHNDAIDDWNGRRIFDEAKTGNLICQNAIDEMIDYLGQGISTICYVLNPETIVLGGGIMSQKEYLSEKVNQSISKHLLPELAKNLKVVFAHHANDAGLLGSYYHFMSKHSELDSVPNFNLK